MKLTMKAAIPALVIALTATGAFAADTTTTTKKHYNNRTHTKTERTYDRTDNRSMNRTYDARNDGRDSNRSWYQGNSQRIYNATSNTNLSGDTARGGGTVGMSNTGHYAIDHGRTYTGEQTSAMVVKH